METYQAGSASESWRIVVFTTISDGLVWKLVEEVAAPMGHRVVAIVTTPGPKRRRNTDYLSVVSSAPPGIDVLVSNIPGRWAEMVAAWKPDLIVSGGFAWLIPEAVVAIPRVGAVNIHPALLPRHRGPAAIEWALRGGDEEFGFTAHRISNEFDAGAILGQIRVPIDDDDDAFTLLEKAEARLPELIQFALTRVARGDAGEPQQEELATYAGFFDSDWREIDWTQPARVIHNQVRSWVGWRDTERGAFGVVDGERLLITRTRIHSERIEAEETPGVVGERRNGSMVVQCGDGMLEILEWDAAEGGP